MEDLLKACVDRHGRADSKPTVKHSASFEVDVPVRFKLLDASGFLLDARTCRFYEHIPVDDAGSVLHLQRRRMGHDVIDISKLPGHPHPVVVRVIGGDE